MDFKGIKQRMLRKEVSPAETPWQRAMEEMKKNKVQKLNEKEEAKAEEKYAEQHRLPKEQLAYWKGKLSAHSRKQSGQQEDRHSYLYWYLLFLTGGLAMGYLISPLGRVQEIFVEGAAYVPEQTIIDASRISGKVTALGVIANSKDIDGYISSKLPQIKKASIALKNFNDITITVQEYKTIAYVYSEKAYYTVLENGVIAKDGLKVPIGNCPIITGFELNQNLNDLLKQYMKLTDTVQNSISEIKYTGTEENPYSITVYMNDGNEIKAILPTFAEKILYYPDIVSQLGATKGIVDLEVGAYFTPFSQSAAETNTTAAEKATPKTEVPSGTDAQSTKAGNPQSGAVTKTEVATPKQE
jgi:cell division protein FtsQ